MELPDGLDQGETPPRGRLRRLLGGRPLSVYGVLLAGVAVLAALLAVVVVTSRPESGVEPLTCLPVLPADAEADIGGGAVERLKVVTEEGQPEVGPLAITYVLNDDGETCRRLPEGISAQPELYRLIGFVTAYNETFAGEQRVRVQWEQQANLPPLLLATATPEPTPTPALAPTATATAIATATATATAPPTATTMAVPPAAATPESTPEPAATATPEPTATTAPPPPSPALPLLPTDAGTPAASPQGGGG